MTVSECTRECMRCDRVVKLNYQNALPVCAEDMQRAGAGELSN